MISTRQKKVNPHIEILVFWDMARHQVCMEHKISEPELKLLMTLYYIQMETNMPVSGTLLTKVFHGDMTFVPRSIHRLVDLGFAQDDGKQGVVVTIEGEYVMRGCSTMLNRHIKGDVLPKWSRLRKNDERREFLRKVKYK